MKKYFYLSAAALATLFATSCSSDDVPAPVDGDMTTFEVQLPDQLTTRFGEGQQATKLYVAVYEQGTKNLLFSNFAGTGNDKNAASLSITPFTTGEKPTCKVSVPLVKGKAYDLVFFAQDAKSSAYGFSTADQTMTVSYTDMTNFDEARDAFFGQIKNFTSGGQGDSVTLTRPFAQINIGTADYQKYLNASGLNAQTFGMKVSGVASTLDLLSGTVEEPATNDAAATVALAGPTPDNTNLIVNGTSYDYLAMGYVLVGGNATTQATLNVDLYVGDETKAFATYPSVPAQMNYRTNIFGDLLTNLENFNVTIDPNFETPANDVSMPTEPKKNAEGNYLITSQGELKWMANEVEKGNTFLGKTFVLQNDITMSEPHQPIGTYVNKVLKPFEGTFDGNHHKIINMTVNVTTYKSGAGFFGLINAPAVVKDITFIDAKVTGTAYTGVVAGLAYKNGNPAYSTITGITVDHATVLSVPAMGPDSKYDGGNNVGGVLGIPQYGLVLKNNTVSNSTITGYIKVGGMIGIAMINNAGNTGIYENNSVVNTTVNQSLTNAYETTIPTTIGEFYGDIAQGEPLPASNTCTNVTVNKAQ